MLVYLGVNTVNSVNTIRGRTRLVDDPKQLYIIKSVTKKVYYRYPLALYFGCRQAHCPSNCDC